MATEVIKIHGIGETIAALRELDRKVERTIVRRATREGAKVIQATAEAEAPVRSGLTRAAVKLRAGGTRNGAYRVNVGVGDKDFAGEAFYAAFVLFGHKVGPRSLGGGRQDVPANNWLVRALQGSQEAAVQATSDALVSGVEAEAAHV